MEDPHLTDIKPITGNDVAFEILQCIGSFKQLHEAFIITYNLQNYDFSGHGLLSRLLTRQIINGASITLMTTPPPGKPHKKAFQDKLFLLEQLDQSGINLHLHNNLHAKVYLFLDDKKVNTTIVGSANLTHRGFGTPQDPNNLLELALITSDPDIYSQTLSLIKDKFLNDQMTSDFGTWKTVNQQNVAIAKGGSVT